MILNSFNDDIKWLSIGENCMGVNVLRRFNLNSPSTLYSSARSNMEHILYLEKTQFRDLFDPNLLITAPSWTQNAVYFTGFKSSSIFSHGPRPYFEFTHHSPQHEEDKKTLMRRITRLDNYKKSCDKKIFFYHHRSMSGFSKTASTIIYRGFKFLNSLYSNSYFICITQSIVKSPFARGVILQQPNDFTLFATLKTVKPWAGDDLDNFFARNDDDLIGSVLYSAAWHFNLE